MEVERGGALLGGQRNKRAWNLTFSVHMGESSDTRIMHARASAWVYATVLVSVVHV